MDAVDSTGTPYGLIAMKRVWLRVAMPDRFICSALAPSGTVTKYDVDRLRSTTPRFSVENAGRFRSSACTTVAIMRWSTTGVLGSSISTMAEWTPVVLVVEVTGSSVRLPFSRTIERGTLNVPSPPTTRTV